MGAARMYWQLIVASACKPTSARVFVRVCVCMCARVRVGVLRSVRGCVCVCACTCVGGRMFLCFRLFRSIINSISGSF